MTAPASNKAPRATNSAGSYACTGIASATRSPADLVRAVQAATSAHAAGFAAGAAGETSSDGVRRNVLLVKAGGEVVSTQLEEFASSIRQLQSLGITPVVVHGGGPQANDELKARGVEPKYVGGHRVTDRATMDIADRVFRQVNEQLCAGLEAAGVPAQAIPFGALKAVPDNLETYGLVGKITGVDSSAVEEALTRGVVPVLTSLGEAEGDFDSLAGDGLSVGAGGALNVNADVAARVLAAELRPYKTVFLSAGGGMRGADGAILAELDMARDFDAMEGEDYEGRQGTLLKLRELKQITDSLPPEASVCVCAAGDLPGQLLPHRGPGTQVRKGSRVVRFDSPGAVDAGRLDALFASRGLPSLEEQVAQVGEGSAVGSPDWGSLDSILVAGDYEAAAVVLRHSVEDDDREEGQGGGVEEDGAPVLHCMAVSPEGTDRGMDLALWASLKEAYPALWWVAEPAAPSAGQAAMAAEGVLSDDDELGAWRAAAWGSALSFDASAEHAAGMVRLVPADVASSGDGGEEEEVEVETEQAGGGAGTPGTQSELRRGYCVAWWGLDEMEEAEDAVLSAALRFARMRMEGYPTGLVYGEEDGGASVGGSSGNTSAARTAGELDAARAAQAAATSSAELWPRKRVALIGARGFTGRELIRVMSLSGLYEVGAAGSRGMAGQVVADALGVARAEDASALSPGLAFEAIAPEDIRAGSAPADPEGFDAWVLALPNGLCEGYAEAIRAATGVTPGNEGTQGPVILDLSADQRFDDSGVWAYGMPERPGARAKVAGARCVSNPGCYATGAQLGLMPLLEGTGALAAREQVPHVFGVSGYSGAGTNPSDKNDPDRLRDNLLPYALVGHIHEREISRHCGRPVAFSPHVAPFFQGISLTLSVHLDGDRIRAAGADPGNKAEVEALVQGVYEAAYGGERAVTVLPQGAFPDVGTHGTKKHGVTVGGFSYDPESGRVGVVSCIDNLLKGAATQAVQNLNLALFGAEGEFAGGFGGLFAGDGANQGKKGL